MRSVTFGIAAIALMSPTPSVAETFLTSLGGEVYETTGTTKEIVARANACISRNLSKGSMDDPLILSSDLDSGVIVARNSIEYGTIMRWRIRSRFTFEAREGRFRIQQTNIERNNTSALTGVNSWGPVNSFKQKEVRAKLGASAALVAQCVINGPKSEEW